MSDIVFKLRGRARRSRLAVLACKLLLPPPKPRYEGRDMPRPIGWNLYRCPSSAEKIEPERWWHRLGWKISAGRYDPFGRSCSARNPF